MNKINLRSWDEVEKELYMEEEIAESELRVDIIRENINAKNQKHSFQHAENK